MPLQLLKRSLYGRRIDACLLFFVGFLDAVKIALQSEALASAIDARHSAKLRAIDGDPLTSDKAAVACETNKFCPGCRKRLSRGITGGCTFQRRSEVAFELH